MKPIWFIVILLLLASVGSRRARQRTDTKEPPPQRPPERRLLRRILWWGERLTAILAGTIALGATVYSAAGPFWPTPPEIEARNPVDGSPSILPFRIGNRSFLFPIRSVTLSCYVNLAFVMDADHKTILLRDGEVIGKKTIFPGDIYYPCAAGLLDVNPNGSLTIGYLSGQHMNSPSGGFRGPLTVLKLCVAVLGSYEDWLGKSRPIQPIMFQWPAVPGAREWIKGPITSDTDESRWIPQDSKWGVAYGARRLFIFTQDGSRFLSPGALLCDWFGNTSPIIAFAEPSDVGRSYLVEPTLAAAQERSRKQCLAAGCDGVQTKYWWGIRRLADGTAVVVIEPSGPQAARTTVGSSIVGLSDAEIAGLKAADLLPAPLLPNEE